MVFVKLIILLNNNKPVANNCLQFGGPIFICTR